MLKRSSIGWCDYSGGDLNVVIRGESCPISEECLHCYVKRWYKRYRKGRMPRHTKLYPEKLKRLQTVQFAPGDQPYRRGPGSKPIMFVADYGDLFCEDVPFAFSFNVLSAIYPRPEADWVLLTKRPERMGAVVAAFCNAFNLKQLPAHIWCMTSAGNQERADERIPMLLRVRAQMLGVSVEPMLGPIDLFDVDGKIAQSMPERSMLFPADMIGWVIAGAESGENRRPFEAAWAEGVYRQCWKAGIPFFGKQDSGLRPGVPLLLACPDCGGSGYVSDGLGSGEGCGCNGQRVEIKEFPR